MIRWQIGAAPPNLILLLSLYLPLMQLLPDDWPPQMGGNSDGKLEATRKFARLKARPPGKLDDRSCAKSKREEARADNDN